MSDGGRGPFVPYAESSLKLPDLAFGHFDGPHNYGNDEKLDVADVVSNQWMVVYAQDPEHQWRVLQPGPALTNTMNGLIVANLLGKGCCDIAKVSPLTTGPNYIIGTEWQVSECGGGYWRQLNTPGPVLSSDDAYQIWKPFAAIGHFADNSDNDGNRAVDILIWNDLSIAILPSGLAGTREAIGHSTHDMR